LLVTQSLHARWQFLIVASFAAIACVCVLCAATQRCVFVTFEREYACADTDTSAQHSGVDGRDLLGVDDEPEDDDELNGTAGVGALFAPRASLRTAEPVCLAPRLAPQTQLERPPRA
jgi:hypothetical protein